MSQGNIILLNGTSSSGKTTIAQALQEVMERPYLHTGIDQLLIERLPKRLIVYSDGIDPATAEGWLTIFRDEALSQVRIGPLGYQWIAGMYRAMAAFVEEGLDVIVDDVIYDQRVLNHTGTNHTQRGLESLRSCLASKLPVATQSMGNGANRFG